MWRIFIPNGEACVPVGAIDSEEIGPDWRLASSELRDKIRGAA